MRAPGFPSKLAWQQNLPSKLQFEPGQQAFPLTLLAKLGSLRHNP